MDDLPIAARGVASTAGTQDRLWFEETYARREAGMAPLVQPTAAWYDVPDVPVVECSTLGWFLTGPCGSRTRLREFPRPRCRHDSAPKKSPRRSLGGGGPGLD